MVCLGNDGTGYAMRSYTLGYDRDEVAPKWNGLSPEERTTMYEGCATYEDKLADEDVSSMDFDTLMVRMDRETVQNITLKLMHAP